MNLLNYWYPICFVTDLPKQRYVHSWFLLEAEESTSGDSNMSNYHNLTLIWCIIHRPYPCMLYGQPLVLFYDKKGDIVCLQDRCSHRSTPLSIGVWVDGAVECRYHGWTFGTGKSNYIALSLWFYYFIIQDGILWRCIVNNINKYFQMESASEFRRSRLTKKFLLMHACRTTPQKLEKA